MNRHLVIASDSHAGLHPPGYRDYLDPAFREEFDRVLPLQLDSTRKAEKMFLVKDINEKWRVGIEGPLTGAWDHDQRIDVLDADGIVGEVLFPDGITEKNAPPFRAGIGLNPVDADPELQWAGARAHNRWLAEFCQMAPERRCGVAIVPATWDVDVAVKEVRWARANGLRAILIPCFWGDHDPYHHPKYDALWAVCQELDVVVNYHSGASDRVQYFGRGGPDEPPLVGAMGIYTTEVIFSVV